MIVPIIAPMSHCVVRFQKIKSADHLQRAYGHNTRRHNAINADTKRRSQNEVLVDGGPSILELWKTKVGDQHIRKNGVLACEVVLIRSAEWVGDEAEWSRLSSEWLVETFGRDRIMSMVVHRDETTPHVQALLVPLHEGKLDATGLWGGRFFLPGLQTSYAQKMAPVGLSRGEEGSVATHVDRREYAARIKRAQETAPEPPKTVLGLCSAAEATRLHQQAIAAHTLAMVEKAKAEKLTKDNVELARENAKLRTDRLREIPLVQVLQKLGAHQDKADSLQWTLSTGEVVAREKGEGMRFNSFTDATLKGRGAHDLVMRALKCDFKGAGAWLASEFGSEALVSELRASDYIPKSVATMVAKTPVPSSVPPPIPANWAHVRDYLVRVRRLAAELVEKLHDAGRVYADFKHNVIFTHADPENTLGGAETRGTTGPKWVGAVGKKNGFFVEGAKPGLVVVESAIDAISCVQLTGMSAVSTGGNNLGAMSAWSGEAKKRGLPLYAGQDQDPKGEEMAALLCSIGAIRLPPPKGKDWNDALPAPAAAPVAPTAPPRGGARSRPLSLAELQRRKAAMAAQRAAAQRRSK